ncbi:MAG: glycoside hydrolase family 3 N-terminal domain-containing protein, partial [Bryobacteraceae bacterium]
PRWGRGQETYGEDPYLTGRMAVAFITGMQGSDPHYLKTVATAKHYAVHSGPESLRHEFDVRPGAEDLKGTYLPAFRASVVEGRASSVMCAYNAVDGVPACASHQLLQETLRQAWSFNGYVVSDCGAVGDILRGHKYKPSMPAAAAAAVDAGTDLDCGTEYRALADAVKQGLIPESEIDRAVERLFVARIRLGMFDPPERVPFSAIPYSEVDSPAHRALALEAARKSIVLLKNDSGTLPLGSSIRRIAVTGPAADDPDALLGNYNGTPSSIVTPLAGIEAELGKQAEVRFSLGSAYTAQSNALLPPDVVAPGLRAEYFDNPNLSGQPLVTRMEPRVYFDWDMRDPALARRIPRQAFSARWTGTIRVGHTGDYQLGVTRFRCEGCFGPDSARLFLDDAPLVGEPEMRPRNPRTEQALAHLEAGRAYKVRLEYRQRGGGSGV